MQILDFPDPEDFPQTAYAVLIGGGIAGTATAFWLSGAGLDTVLVITNANHPGGPGITRLRRSQADSDLTAA